MSLKSKIEAVIYASEEPVTLQQLVVLLSEEVQFELDALAALQTELPLGDAAQPAPVPQASAATTDPDGPAFDNTQADSQGNESATRQESTGDEPGQADDAPALPDSNPEAAKRLTRERERAVREYLRGVVDALMRDYADSDRGLEIREVAGGFRFGTKPEYHDAVRGFVKSLKPALKLSLQALETLAVVAYKQPVTAAEISEIRGVDSAGVLGGLLTRKLIQTAGRKQVIGRPMLYKTTKEFLVRFGLKDVQELPSMEEFERMAGELAEQEDLPMEGTDTIIERANARGDAEHIREINEQNADDTTTEASATSDASTVSEAGQAPDADSSKIDSAPKPDTRDHARADQSSPRNEAEPSAEEQEPK